MALTLPGTLAAQQIPPTLLQRSLAVAGQDAPSSVTLVGLPDAPKPQFDPASDTVAEDAAEYSSSQTPQAAVPAQTPASQQTQAQQPETPEERRAKAAAELKAEESQRMAGIVPNFMAVNNGKAEPISPGQKFQLFFKGAFDSYQFVLVAIDAGIGQAENSDEGYHQGLKGFARRYGANYGDNFDGNLWGNAILPSLLHQDPRYFRLGHGPKLHRLAYSISTTFRTRGDNGKWQPAYSNLMGNLIGASISNLYYPNFPDDERGLYPTLRRGLSITYQGTIGGLLEEFYPDIAQHFKNKHQAKLARQTAATDSPATPDE